MIASMALLLPTSMNSSSVTVGVWVLAAWTTALGLGRPLYGVRRDWGQWQVGVR
jgi:hypothetical protein